MGDNGSYSLNIRQAFAVFLTIGCLLRVPAMQFSDIPGNFGMALGILLTLALNTVLSLVWAKSYAYFEGTRSRRGLIASASTFVVWVALIGLGLWAREILGWDSFEWVFALFTVFLTSSLFASGALRLRK